MNCAHGRKTWYSSGSKIEGGTNMREETRRQESNGPELPPSLLSRLFERLPESRPEGYYDAKRQTWSHREGVQFSPSKHNQEM